MREKYYLPLYQKWIEDGGIPTNGLCKFFGEELRQFEPTLKYSQERYVWVEHVSEWYWGYNGERENTAGGENRANTFSPLRQNIVLLMAAMAGEL